MKRTNLTTAIVAGLTGIAGLASVSNAAVSINNDGIGQVLVFPYYTVNNDLNTLISVVNTTNTTKAVKVRFLEGKNSREVLDFNLYLSPYDVWTGALAAEAAVGGSRGIIDGSFAGYIGDDSVKVITNDQSCTVPNDINQTQFKPYAFDGDGVAMDNMSRSTEGHFEMIEMGVVTDSYAAAILHGNDGVPANCALIQSLWFDQANTANVWNSDNAGNGGEQGSINVLDTVDGFGGLFGSAYIVDPVNGFAVSYNADALQGARTTRDHTNPGSLLPSIATVTGSFGLFDSVVFSGGSVEATSWTNGADAVSALYMHDNLYNEYVLSDSVNGNTEWVVTFPTKALYVDPERNGNAPVMPFTTTISAAGACEPMNVDFWDREEGPNITISTCPVGTILYIDPTSGAQSCISPPSPPPTECTVGVDPLCTTPTPSLCWETNVVEFTNDSVQAGSGVASAILGSTSKRGVYLPVQGDGTLRDEINLTAGFAKLNFVQTNTTGVDTVTSAAQTYTGLPVTGFAVQRFQSTTTGKLYGSIFRHRASRNISN